MQKNSTDLVVGIALLVISGANVARVMAAGAVPGARFFLVDSALVSFAASRLVRYMSPDSPAAGPLRALGLVLFVVSLALR